MTKRSFFKSIMGAVAAVALAPEIAFGRLKMPQVETCHGGSYYWFRDALGIETGEWIPYDADELRATGLNHLANLPYSEFQRLRKEAGLTN